FVFYGYLARVDFHKFLWEGRPLLERFRVTYGVDLPRVRSAAPALGKAPLAILVANPRGDVPGTGRAAPFVEVALKERGFRVELIEGEAATHDAVRAAL